MGKKPFQNPALFTYMYPIGTKYQNNCLPFEENFIFDAENEVFLTIWFPFTERTTRRKRLWLLIKTQGSMG